jgi:MFS transporter, DHA2 family, multidrug resistance protein
MATAALPLPHSADIDGFRKTMITIAVMVGTLVVVLDQTIANVALPHMQTSLGATPETVTWVLTSYIVASAIAIPITGWLADRVGRKLLFVTAVTVFTGASVLCAVAQNLPEMVLFRVLQGAAGSFIVPMAQSVLFDINPPEKHGKAMAMFGAGVMIGPILGPVLGGWLTEDFNWRWVFLVNLPIGTIATLMLWRFLPHSDTRRTSFDLLGFGLLAIGIGAFQMMLDRGEQLDWFASWEIMIELGLAIAGIWMFVVHMATAKEPIFDPKMFANRNFTIGLLFMSVAGVLMLGGLALLPPLLQNLYGYSVLQSGFLTAPRGIGTLISMILAGRLVGKVDARLLVLFGISCIGVSLWQMSGFTLDMGRRLVVTSGIVQGLGMGFIFVPLNTIAFGALEAKYRTTAASLFNLARSIGGSVGISVLTVFLARNTQISHADLAQHITPYTLPSVIPQEINAVGQVTETALSMMNGEITRQAVMIAYIDDFRLMMFVCVFAAPLLLLLRKAKRPQGKPEMHVME